MCYSLPKVNLFPVIKTLFQKALKKEENRLRLHITNCIAFDKLNVQIR